MEGRRLGFVAGIALLLALAITTTSYATTYSGSLQSNTGGITVADSSKNNQGAKWLPISFSWVVTQNANNSWNYAYTFQESSSHDLTISHLIVEVSPTFTNQQVLDFSGKHFIYVPRSVIGRPSKAILACRPQSTVSK